MKKEAYVRDRQLGSSVSFEEQEYTQGNYDAKIRPELSLAGNSKRCYKFIKSKTVAGESDSP